MPKVVAVPQGKEPGPGNVAECKYVCPARRWLVRWHGLESLAWFPGGRRRTTDWPERCKYRQSLTLPEREDRDTGTFSPWPLSLVDRADSLLLNVGE